MGTGSLGNLPRMRPHKTRRISSFDRSGGNRDHIGIAPRTTVVLAEIEGSGSITHIWCTVSSKDPLYRRNLVLRMYWDGQDYPSVEAPLGDFFGQGWGLHYNWASAPLAAAPRDGGAMVCYFPMPFAKGARIEIENQGDEPVGAFYYYIDYEERPVEPDEGRFHAWYNQELTGPESDFGDRENEWAILGETPKNPSDANNYLFCECEGAGQFVGVNYYVHCPTPIWYGEGDDMFLVDGEPWPGSAHGTGTEDYFNQAWSPDELYAHPCFGTAYAPGRNNEDPLFGWLGRTHCYRFHIDDPIRFQKSLRASIEHGHANTLTLEIASVAYWYQTLPGKPFPEMPTAEHRKPLPLVQPVNVHVWRDAWREKLSGGKKWRAGDE